MKTKEYKTKEYKINYMLGSRFLSIIQHSKPTKESFRPGKVTGRDEFKVVLLILRHMLPWFLDPILKLKFFKHLNRVGKNIFCEESDSKGFLLYKQIVAHFCHNFSVLHESSHRQYANE